MFLLLGLISLGLVSLLISGVPQAYAKRVLDALRGWLCHNCPWIGYRLALRSQRLAEQNTIDAMWDLRENSELPRIIRISSSGGTER
jgi:hypothetical protein